MVVTDEEIRALNATWRGKDRATDVLSFPQEEGEVPAGAKSASRRDTGPRVLGDVVISFQTAARQAQSAGHSLEAEMRRLLVHGLLHLLGYDHVQGGRQAAKMKREEARLLGLLVAELGE